MMMMQSRSETQAVEVDNNEGDDNGSLLKSLIDRNQRGLTFDLDGNNTMQQSALYSKRLLANADGRFDQDMGNQEEAQGRLPNTNSPARGTTTGSESTTTRENNNNTSGSNKETTATTTTTTSPSAGDGGLESVALSLGNLYVGQGENEQTSETATATNSVVPATAIAATASSNIPPSGVTPGTGPPSDPTQAPTGASGTQPPNPATMYRGPGPGPGLAPGVMMPGGVGPQGQMMPPVQYVPVEGDNGPGGVPGAPGGPPGPAFFMPHMYMDQNGQPVYYRMPNPNAGPYQQQEMMYAGGPEGGNPGDPLSHVAYSPYPGPPYFDAQGQPVYMGPGGAMPGMVGPDGRRMVYNPAMGPQGGPIPQPYGMSPRGPNAQGQGPGPGQYPYHPHHHHPNGGMGHMGQHNNMGGPHHNREGHMEGHAGMLGTYIPRDQGGARHANMGDRGDHSHRGGHGGNGMRGDRGDRNGYGNGNSEYGGGGGRGGHRDGGRNSNNHNMDGNDNRQNERRERRDREEREYGRSSGNSTGGNNPVRDPLVDEFRCTYGKSRQWGLSDLLGHVVAFCQDQHGSRFIQQRLEICTEMDKQLIFDEIMPMAHLLMTDVFGNYVLQKLFEYGTPEQCEALAVMLSGQAVQLSMQMYGCRVVQKALEYVSTQRLIALVSEFESPPVLLRCVHDSNGNHVIQKCIEIVSRVAKEAATPELSEYLSSRIQFIIEAFQGRIKELSSHPYGCRVVQRILEHCSNPQKSVILEELRQCCSELVQDCYGNYVIQFVMQHGWEADRAVLIHEVQSHLLDFSQHKFASNVVEKCLQYASKRDRDEMIWTIINVTFDLANPVDAKTGHCVLESMVRDPYANYVVQKVIDVSDERQRGAIMRYVKENIVQLRRYTYGKHIIVRLEKITNEKFA